MTSAVPTAADVLEEVNSLGPPGTPLTTPEVAEDFDCTQRTIYNRLESLVKDGVLQMKKSGPTVGCGGGPSTVMSDETVVLRTNMHRSRFETGRHHRSPPTARWPNTSASSTGPTRRSAR
jgi:hypothetical protein